MALLTLFILFWMFIIFQKCMKILLNFFQKSVLDDILLIIFNFHAKFPSIQSISLTFKLRFDKNYNGKIYDAQVT